MSKTQKFEVSNVFRFLTGDVNYTDYGGKWYRKVASTRYHVIELTNMWQDTKDKTCSQYHVSLSEVDIASSQLQEALDSCGPDEGFRDNELAKVDSLATYGCKAPLGQWNGNNYKKLITEARNESRNLNDPEKYEAAMSRPVNAIGSTAREFAVCDFQSAIKRGVARDDANAKLMAKLHGYQPSETITFGTLNPNGQVTNVKNLNGDDIRKCRFCILSPDHYRSDGSCKCNNREHRAMMIQEWEYREEQFEGIPLVD